MLVHRSEVWICEPVHNNIDHHSSLWAKKDGKLCPVVNFRKLNDMTIPDQYPLPLIQELVDKVKDAQIFTKLDIQAGCNNIWFREGDEFKPPSK